jgi:hypothetical protein
MKKDTVEIAGTTFFLARGVDVQDVKNAVAEALRNGGDLVDLVVYGNSEVSVAVSSGIPVVFRSEEVDVDERDTSDLADRFHPFVTIESFEAL